MLYDAAADAAACCCVLLRVAAYAVCSFSMLLLLRDAV